MKTPTFATSSKSAHPHLRAQRGFTLVELLVVFAIAALLVGLTPVAFERLRESTQYRNTLRDVLSDLRTARQQAVVQARDTRFDINLGSRSFGIQGGKPRSLPEKLEVMATVAAMPAPVNGGEQIASIIFLPNGGATGGSIDLRRPSGTGVRLRVDWMSGKVIQEQLPQ